MLGISTYAYLWRSKPESGHALTLAQIMDDVAGLGLGLLQICDSAEFDATDAAGIAALRHRADSLGLELELGTRGVGADHLLDYLQRARLTGARLVRSMIASATSRPTPEQALDQLLQVRPAFEEAGVTLALETYEQVPTRTLVDLVQKVDSPAVGICLDPGNCLAALERPDEVIALAAPHTVNVHLKDIGYQRSDDQIGFRLAGRPMGEGLLPLTEMLAAVGDQPNRIIEHWLPWQGDWDTQLRREAEWVGHEVDVHTR